MNTIEKGRSNTLWSYNRITTPANWMYFPNKLQADILIHETKITPCHSQAPEIGSILVGLVIGEN